MNTTTARGRELTQAWRGAIDRDDDLGTIYDDQIGGSMNDDLIPVGTDIDGVPFLTEFQLRTITETAAACFSDRVYHDESRTRRSISEGVAECMRRHVERFGEPTERQADAITWQVCHTIQAVHEKVRGAGMRQANLRTWIARLPDREWYEEQVVDRAPESTEATR